MAKNRSLSQIRKEEEIQDLETKSNQIKDWIESVIKDKLPKQSLREILVDGVVLCKLANALKSGCIKKFHRKPRMLMMKMENIAFFLAACKTRFNIPPTVMFAPTDIADDGDHASMRKVVNVLMLIKNELAEGSGESIAEAAERLRQAEEQREKDIERENAEEGIVVEKKEKPVFVIPELPSGEGEPEPEPELEPEPVSPQQPLKAAHNEPEVEPEPEPEPPKPVKKEPEPVKKPEPAKKPEPEPAKKPEPAKPHAEPAKAHAPSKTESEYDWYLHGKSEPVNVQADVSKEILAVINAELSIESKHKLVLQLQGQIEALQNKLMNSSNDDLRHLAHSMGLGESLNDVPATKPRQWYIDFINKHGRGQ